MLGDVVDSYGEGGGAPGDPGRRFLGADVAMLSPWKVPLVNIEKAMENGGFMGKSWEYMGIPSGKHTKSY